MMAVEIICGKCGTKIGAMKVLKPIKDASKVINGKCPACGHGVSTTEFSIDALEE